MKTRDKNVNERTLKKDDRTPKEGKGTSESRGKD